VPRQEREASHQPVQGGVLAWRLKRIVNLASAAIISGDRNGERRVRGGVEKSGESDKVLHCLLACCRLE
jgi:hypothetical protein